MNTTTTTPTTYVLRQLDFEGNPIGDASNPTYYSYGDAIKTAWYIYRKYDQVYGIQGSDGSFKVLSPESI